MDYVLPSSIVSDIYNYLSWDTLKFYSLHDRFWKQQINYFFPDNYYSDAPCKTNRKYFNRFVRTINEYLMFCKYGCLIPNALMNNVDFVKLAIKKNPDILLLANMDIRNRYEVILDAVTKDGSALRFASPALCGDRHIVMCAIEQQADAIQFASEELKTDKKIALMAIERDADTIQYVSTDLYCDKDVIVAALNGGDKYIINHITNQLWKDYDIVRAALNGGCCWYMLHKVPNYLWNQRDIIVATMKNNISLLKFTQFLKENIYDIMKLQSRMSKQKSNIKRYINWAWGFESYYLPIINPSNILEYISEKYKILETAVNVNHTINKWVYNKFYLRSLSVALLQIDTDIKVKSHH